MDRIGSAGCAQVDGGWRVDGGPEGGWMDERDGRDGGTGVMGVMGWMGWDGMW
jgi:hypothetical protein